MYVFLFPQNMGQITYNHIETTAFLLLNKVPTAIYYKYSGTPINRLSMMTRLKFVVSFYRVSLNAPDDFISRSKQSL